MAIKIRWMLIAISLGALNAAAVVMIDAFIDTTDGGARTGLGIVKYSLPAAALAAFSGAGYAIGTLKTRLRDTERELEAARARLNDEPQQAEIRNLMKELSANLDHLQDITNNIDEGICVIDSNGVIEYGFNRRFLEIFGQADYAGASIMDTIFKEMPAASRREVKEYIDLCFQSAATSESMLNDVNPITKFTYYSREGGKSREKILRSKTVRITDTAGVIVNVMFIFDDVTLDEKLDAALEKQDKAYQDEMSIMALIYKNDKDMIISFINEANHAVERVQQKYLEIEQDEPNDERLRAIQGIIHLVKGEAFALGFSEIARSAEEMELFIKSIVGGPVSLDHNLTLIAQYETIYNNVSKVNGVAQKLFSIGEGTQKFVRDAMTVSVERHLELKNGIRSALEKLRAGELQPGDLTRLQMSIDNLDTIDLGILEKELGLITEKTALNYNKRVGLNFIFDIDGLPERQYRLAKEALVHLVRNSIAHGIEDVPLRREKGKDPTGRINIHLYRERARTVILYTDDGAGFDLERIKRKAVESGLATGEDLAAAKDNKIIGFVFNEGFSTTEKADMISGTGVGLSVVRNTILHELKGSIAIRNRPERGVSITLSFP